MLNPLLKKDKNITKSKPSVQDTIQTKDEIFCKLCKQKFIITLYRQHIGTHKRANKPKMSTYYKRGINLSNESNADEESFYIANDIDMKGVNKFKRSFFATLAESRAIRSQNIDKYSQQGNPQPITNTAHGFAKFHSEQLKQSVTFSDKFNFPYQNPQYRSEKSSIIDMLKPQKYAKGQEHPTKSQNLQYDKK